MAELEIYSDFICVWCYFAKKDIKRLEKEYAIKIRWRAFPLNPDIKDDGILIEELFADNLTLMTDKMHQLKKTAESLSLPLINLKTISNSRLAQELAKWAEEKGKFEEYQDAIYKAYFAEGLNIGKQDVLLEIVEKCGFSYDEALEIIKTKKFSKAVDEDWQKSEDLVIQSAPSYILNNTKLMGPQSYEKLEELMKKNDIPRRDLL